MSKVQLHACILIVVLGFASIAAKFMSPLTLGGSSGTSFSKIPLNFAGWNGEQSEFDEETRSQLPSASLLLRYYMHDSYDSPVELAIVYGTDFGSFHQPEFCLEGQGMRRVKSTKVRISGGDGTEYETASAIMESDYDRYAFVYWFLSEGVSSTSLGNYKVRLLIDGLRRGRKIEPSAMIRLSTRVVNTDEQAIGQLVHFAEDITPYIKQEFAGDTGQDTRK